MPANPTPAEGVVVPLEATDAMMDAMFDAARQRERHMDGGVGYVQLRAAWEAALAARPAAPTQSAAQTGEACRCSRCVNEAVAAEGGSGFDTRLMQMFLCTQCGNKRCPHATDHRLSCTNSNEAGQEGSSYGPPLYRRDQATLIEAQAAEIEEARRLLTIFDKHLGEDDGMWTDGSTVQSEWIGKGGVRHSLTFGLFRQVRAFLASRTERADG